MQPTFINWLETTLLPTLETDTKLNLRYTAAPKVNTGRGTGWWGRATSSSDGDGWASSTDCRSTSDGNGYSSLNHSY